MLKILILFFILFSSQSFAKEVVSSSQIINQIEKSLLFNKETRKQIDVYNYNKKANKSTDYADFGNVEGANLDENVSEIDIVVIDPKRSGIDVRMDEKAAYNAALISQYEVAIALYKKVIAKEPKNNYAKFALAVSYQKIGQLKQAKNIYYELLKNNPDNPEEITENLLAVLVEESPMEATYVLSRLSTQNPNSPEILAQAALAYEKIGDYDSSIKLFSDAINLNPERVDYKYNLAVIYDRAEKYDNALALYSEIVENSLDSPSIEVDEVRNRIKYLKSMI